MAQPKKADVLIFSPHPDDAEIFVGGTISSLVAKKYRVGLIDMTRGELGSQGSEARRKQESAKADKILKVAFRKNLGLRDGGLSDPALERQNLAAVVKAIREFRPSVVIAPYWEDRHPDHVGTGTVVSKGIFFAELRKYRAGGSEQHMVDQALFYPTRVHVTPSILIDTSAYHKTKLAAINCYRSQVKPDPKLKRAGVRTLVSSPLAISSISDRDGYFGSMIGVRYAEPFVIRNAIGVADPVKFFKERPLREALFWER